MLPEPPPEQEREAASPRGGRAFADRPLPTLGHAPHPPTGSEPGAQQTDMMAEDVELLAASLDAGGDMNATNKAGLTLLQVANERAKHKSQRFLMVSSPDL